MPLRRLSFLPSFLSTPFLPKSMIRALFLSLPLFLTACHSSAPSSSFRPNTLPGPEESPNIFKFYSAKEDAKPARGWVSSFDFSGVSFDSRKTATLVTPRHVVMAQHFKRKAGASVIFHDGEGKRLVRTLTKVRKVLGDVAVGELNTDVPSRFKVYRLPRPSRDESVLLNRLVAVTDQNRRVFFHRVRAISGSGISFAYDKSEKHGWGKKLISGDSGNPSFLIAGPELVLVETHSTGGPGAGPFYGSPALQQALQDTISMMTPGYRLRFDARKARFAERALASPLPVEPKREAR